LRDKKLVQKDTKGIQDNIELLVAVIEQLFLPIAFSAVPFTKGDETACCRAGDDCRFAFSDEKPKTTLYYRYSLPLFLNRHNTLQERQTL
jgi:hypothetical protein